MKDIVIVGGGMVGGSLACALRQSKKKVTLIDSSPLIHPDDPRLIALNYGSVAFLKKLNLFDELIDHAAAIHTVHVSHRGRFGTTRIHAKELKLPALGYVVPAKQINFVIDEALKQSDIEVIRPATLTGLIENEDAIEITLDSATHLTSKMIIAADGTHSTVRNLLSIPIEEYDYNQNAIVSQIELKRFHQHIAYERFLDTGAIAMLPLMGDRCAMIWSGPRNQMIEWMALSDELFVEKLQKVFGLRVGKIKNIAKRYTFPLKSIQVKKLIHDKIILIGNAAHTLHPLAAQGLNLALTEIAKLSELINNQSMAEINLKILDDKSFSQNFRTNLSDHLNSLFTVDFLPFNIARQIGMIGLNLSGKIKQELALRLAGL